MLELTETPVLTTPMARKVRVKLPGPLKSVTPIGAEFSFHGQNVSDLFRAIDQACPGFLARITESNGKLRPYIRIFINGKSTDSQKGMNTDLAEGDLITFMLSFAGG